MRAYRIFWLIAISLLFYLTPQPFLSYEPGSVGVAALPIGTPTLIPEDLSDADRLYEIGLVLFESERFAAAERHFSAAIRQQHDFTEAYFLRARSRVALGDYPLALQDFTTVLQADPLRADAYHQRGLTLAAMGNTGAALTDIDQAIQISASPIYLNDRGQLYVELEDLEAALGDFSLAIELDPSLPAPYLHRARIFFTQEETEAAKDDLNRYLRLAPGDDPLYEEALTLLAGLSPEEE